MKNSKRILALCALLVFVLSMFSTAAYAKDIPLIGPVARVSVAINGDPRTSRGFCWYTPKETVSMVKIYKDGVDVTSELSLSIPICEKWEGNYMHKVTVSGMEPGTTYTYQVGDGTNWSGVGTFTTDDGDDNVNLVVVADVQASSLKSFESGANVLQSALDMMPDYDFVANMGDFTNDSDNEEWNYYDAAFKDLNLQYTIAPAAGNHDGFSVWHWFNNMFNLDTTESVQTLNGVNYSYDYGNAHFAVLNTNDMASLSDAQLEWLENDLNSTDKDWKILFLHKSPYTLGKDGKWMEAGYTRPTISAICDRCGVDLVMSGHDHMYLRTKTLQDSKVSETGTTYVLAGTAGSKRYEIRSFMANSFLDTNLIAAMTIQKKGYGNYWDPNEQDWDQSKDTNIGGCFSTVSIKGGELTLNAYIVADEKAEDGSNVITNIDTFTISKEVGQNTATYSGDNTTDVFTYIAGIVPSFRHLAEYTLTTWLPTFVRIIPKIIYVYITEGVF